VCAPEKEKKKLTLLVSSTHERSLATRALEGEVKAAGQLISLQEMQLLELKRKLIRVSARDGMTSKRQKTTSITQYDYLTKIVN